MLKTYDKTSSAYVESPPKIHSETAGAWIDAPSAKTYDETEQAWIERLCKFFEVTYYKSENGSSYQIIDGGNGITCSIQGDSEDYYRIGISGLNIPAGAVLSFYYEPAYWDCYTSVSVSSGTLVLLNYQLSDLDAGQTERVPSNNYPITDIEFVFSRPTSAVNTLTGATIKNVYCGNLKFKFNG